MEDWSDGRNVLESNAPFLQPIIQAETKDFICCAEALEIPKKDVCVNQIQPCPIVHCLYKNRLREKKKKSEKQGLPERDILFRPVRFRCKKRRSILKIHEPSLGNPIGLTKSSFGMTFLQSNLTYLSLQGFATTLIAFAEYHITPEKEWTEETLNRILIEGHNLFMNSIFGEQQQRLIEASIKRTFMLCDNAFHLLVEDPFLIGNVHGKEYDVPNLHWALSRFFKKCQFCLLQIGKWYTMIWKNIGVYFVFDCFARRIQDFRSDRKRGTAMLICLRCLDNVSHLLMNLSGVQPEQLFTIRELRIKSLVPCGGEPTPEVVYRSTEYEIISPDYALLRGSLHLGSVCFKEIRYRHSLPVAICALINAKVDATPTWNTAVVDKVLKLGAHFYKKWTECDISLELGIQDVPSSFTFGQFMVQIAVSSITECGMWKCTPNYRATEITEAVQRAFTRGGNLLLQIHSRFYALWRKGTFYYLLDPYSHKCYLGRKKMVASSLRMCANTDRLCCILTQSLLELFEESRFLIRLVKILHLEELDKMDKNRRRAQIPCMCIATAQKDYNQEVASINDSVFGVDGYECEGDVAPPESEADDLDSPGLSQTRMQDYTDLRSGFVEDEPVDVAESESENGDEDLSEKVPSLVE